MCGFAGFTGYLENGKDVLTDMKNKIIHRGPDSAGQYIDDKAYMGFRRLSIIDLDNGSQPMFNENKKIVITFNGEIYNVAVNYSVVERLNSKEIPCTKESLLLTVPYNKCKHTTKLI